MTTRTVCVPDAERRAGLLELGADRYADLIVWDGTTPAPEGIERTSFLLAPYRIEPFSADRLALMPGLEAIQLMSAGFETWETVCPPGVALCAGRTLHGSSTAEVAVAGILMLLHRHPELLRQQWEGTWRAQPRAGLQGRRAVVVGPGDIGRTVASVLEAFGARVTLVGRTARDGVLGQADLRALLPQQDVVVLTTPLTEETRGLVDAEFLARLPEGAIVVNVSRGPVVDTDALADALEREQVRAVLDVTDPEPLPPDHRLWRMPGLILTPHVGGAAAGWERRADALVIEQLERWSAGRDLLHRVR
ncbi:NAD(P)-dependent oxidoreductase [Streptomyces sp. NPDC012510]|uniref:NAD(P)-dependent oxidoreductase n=1 Tax=Streptomyces sp. NPDC012510 TaxID=3364838 RepID=UPI0036E98962